MFPRTAINRYFLLILTVLLIIGVVLAGMLALTIIGAIAGPLAILVAIVLFAAAVFYLLRLVLLPMVLVDDQKPLGVRDALARSFAVWKPSKWAIVMYGLMILAIALIVTLATSNFQTTPQPQPKSSAQTAASLTQSRHNLLTPAGIGGLVISTVIGSLFNIVIYSGLADIYNEAQNRR